MIGPGSDKKVHFTPLLKDLPRLPPGFGKVEIPRVDLGIFGRLADISSTYIWVYVGIWVYMGIFGRFVDILYTYIWVYVGIYGCIWAYSAGWWLYGIYIFEYS